MSKIVRGGTVKPPRVVIYSGPKLGKTTWLSESDTPIIVTTEEGADGLPVDFYEQAKDWEELLGNLREAAASKVHKTLGLDTLNGAAVLCAEHICKTMFGGDWSPKGYGSFGKGPAATAIELRKMIPILDSARDSGKTVILLAHLGTTNVNNPVEGEYSKWTPDLGKNAWPQFYGWADIIGRADYDYDVAAGSAPGQKGRAVGTSTRVLHFAGNAAQDAGCRAGFALPEKIPFTWAAFKEALGKTDTLVAAVKEGWDSLSKDGQERALKYLGGSVEKATATKLSVVLDNIRSKQKEQTNG